MHTQGDNAKDKYFENNIKQVYHDNDNGGFTADLERTAPQYLGEYDSVISTGDIPGKGNYSCLNCGTDITLTDGLRMPVCPRCNNLKFTRIS